MADTPTARKRASKPTLESPYDIDIDTNGAPPSPPPFHSPMLTPHSAHPGFASSASHPPRTPKTPVIATDETELRLLGEGHRDVDGFDDGTDMAETKVKKPLSLKDKQGMVLLCVLCGCYPLRSFCTAHVLAQTLFKECQ